jgi:general secretion pathway protein G
MQNFKISRRQFLSLRWDGLRRSGRSDGFTFIELLIVSTILIILASAVMPLAKVTMQRQKEAELRRCCARCGRPLTASRMPWIADYPGNGSAHGQRRLSPDLETLVEGVSVANDASGRKLKFLRRIPIDPMTNSTEWGMRSCQDRPDSISWGGQNGCDVFTKSTGTGLDGTKQGLVVTGAEEFTMVNRKLSVTCPGSPVGRFDQRRSTLTILNSQLSCDRGYPGRAPGGPVAHLHSCDDGVGAVSELRPAYAGGC